MVSLVNHNELSGGVPVSGRLDLFEDFLVGEEMFVSVTWGGLTLTCGGLSGLVNVGPTDGPSLDRGPV